MKAGKTPPAPPARAGAVAQAAAELGFALDDVQAGRLAEYLNLLQEWNRRMNLVGPATWPEVLSRLVVDSFHLSAFVRELPLPVAEGTPEAPRTLDLGAGAGLPGIPLRILWPAGRYAMVEAREKRATFLEVALARLGLLGGHEGGRTEVFPGRVEALPARLLPAELIMGRAFMPWPKLLRLVRPMLASGGIAVIFANEPLPSGAPDGFAPVCSQEYRAAGDARYFWAFTPVNMDR